MEITKYNRLSEVLAAKDKSNKWLAEKLGVSDVTVSNWCSQNYQPSWPNLYAIADLLEIDVRELFVPNKKSPRKDFKF
jgi:putative transcriptional regulator